MTNKEAIRRILDHKRVHSLHEPRAVLINEALDLAIKALEERPQGEWILNKDENPECPFCHSSFTYWGNFCGNCGAAMQVQSRDVNNKETNSCG